MDTTQLTESEVATVKQWLRWFGESPKQLQHCDICENGSVYLGLVQVAPPNTITYSRNGELTR